MLETKALVWKETRDEVVMEVQVPAQHLNLPTDQRRKKTNKAEGGEREGLLWAETKG